MYKGMSLLSLLLFAASSSAALDNQIIQSEQASRIALAGKIGQAAMFSVQADDDADLEIFVTASSMIDSDNDHWLVLDRNVGNTDYDVIARGELQTGSQAYTSAYQTNYQEILIGHKGGKLSKIKFVDNADATQHDINSESLLLSSLASGLPEDTIVDIDIKAIVSLTGTDQNEYVALCTSNYLHIYTEASGSLKSSVDTGGYCQTGNVDYQKVDGSFDEELVTENGLYFTFDGMNFIEKTGLEPSNFGGNFRIANIDDDAAEEILSQAHTNTPQVQSYSPLNGGSWVYISALSNTKNNFSVIDLNFDGIKEILFDYITSEEAPYYGKIVQVGWDTDLDSHVIEAIEDSPFFSVAPFRKLPTKISLADGTVSDFYLFTSNVTTANPSSSLLHRYDTGLRASWKGIQASATRSFDNLTRVSDGNNLADFKLLQLEQIDLGADIYQFAYKTFNLDDFGFEGTVTPDFTNDEIISIDALTSFDFDEDGVDELHAGGQSIYDTPQGIVISSYLDGTDQYTLSPADVDKVTALIVENLDDNLTPDIFASGKNTGDDNGIGYSFYFDGSNIGNSGWFNPGTGDTDFKDVIASNIKGGSELEILGLHSQLTSYNPNAIVGESSFYNLTNLDLNAFTPITLNNRDFDFALASDASGLLHLIEPKDLDILASIQACDEEITAISNIRIDNDVVVALGVCGQSLKAWAVEYDQNIIDYGYELVELASYDLGAVTTDNTQLRGLVTDDSNSLIAIFKNQFTRFTINSNLGNDDDSDGYLNYQDHFPSEITQWADADSDGLGDNQTDGAINPDPSLNDIDNDGILDDADLDNDPENDMDISNDIDHGYPNFTDAPLAIIKTEYVSALTTVNLASPNTTDIYDNFVGNGSPTVTASILNTGLVNRLDQDSNPIPNEFETALEAGVHTVSWAAQDVQGNTTTTTQEVWVYPTIAFESASQRVGEGQTANIKIVLSGLSPEYPFSVSISTGNSTVENSDVSEDISQDLTVTFEEGEVEAFLNIEFPDEHIAESDEMLELTLVDSFASTPENASWAIDADNNLLTITVADVNIAPVVSYSIEQAGSQYTALTNIAGTINLIANVMDGNTSDSHIYSWNLVTLGIEDPVLLPTASFNPAEIVPGIYTISVTVTDNGLPAITTIETIQITLDYGDSDGDGTLDNLDAFPNDVNEDTDTDNDGVGNNADAFPNDENETLDSDDDGVGDNSDAFPNNTNETLDSDGDGVGNNSDAFPNNRNETLDSDGDSIGDNSDAFPNNGNEFLDSDGDGIGDNSDAFPNDRNETIDSDGDGIGDNADFLPNDSTETKDRDGDGVGDNADAFPNDAKESIDSDGDGVGDNEDDFDNDPSKSNADDERSLEANAGALYLYLLMLLPLLFRKRK